LLVAEALRVLKPGGLLILETPNPENVVVGTTDFYLDPTHQRPIPPLLLSFLPEFQGFARVKILRLQESSDLAKQEDVTLKDVFFGTSPDYAVVAQKNADSSILQSFITTFDKQYGIELGELANRYDARIERRLVAFDQRVGNIESSASGMTEAISRISTLQDRLIEANSQSERNQYRATQLSEQLHHAEALAHDHEQRALAAEARATEAEAIRETTHKELHTIHLSNHPHWQLAETRQQHIQALLKLHHAEALAHDHEQRALAAEAQARDQEQRALAAEAQARNQEQRALAAEAQARDQEQRALAAEARATEAEAIRETTQKELHAIHLSNHHHWQLAETRQQHIQALLNSASWRVTAPLRWLGALALKTPGAQRTHAISNDPVGQIIRYVANRPALTRWGLLLIKPFPNLESRLREKRAAQIRSNFLSWENKAGGEKMYRMHENQEAGDALSLISPSATRLTADEILTRIRRELDDGQVEK
jgi:O-antigen chain-terminating methyltransferase